MFLRMAIMIIPNLWLKLFYINSHMLPKQIWKNPCLTPIGCSMSSGNKRSYLLKQVHSFSSRLFWVCMPSITTRIKGLECIPWQVYITLILPLNSSTLYADLEVPQLLLGSILLILIIWAIAVIDITLFILTLNVLILDLFSGKNAVSGFTYRSFSTACSFFAIYFINKLF